MNLFRQAIYKDKIKSKEDQKPADMGRTMCMYGVTGIKAGSLSHGQKWRRHKYLYIDENGNYVYPEDVANKGKKAVGDAANKGKQVAEDTADKVKAKLKELNTIAKDKKFLSNKYVKDYQKKHPHPNTEGDPYRTAAKTTQQLTSSHQEGTKRASGKDYFNMRGSNDTYRSYKTKDLDNQVSKTAARKRKRLAEDQRKSAHAGYEEDRRNFPEGGSTEELERQRRKTKARKSAKNIAKDTNVVRISSATRENERDRHNQHKQINSAHQEATRFRPEPGHLYNGDWVLESRTHNNSSKSVERQKRKAEASNSRHKTRLEYGSESYQEKTPLNNKKRALQEEYAQRKAEESKPKEENKKLAKKAGKMTESEKRKRENAKKTDQYKKSRNYKIAKNVRRFVIRRHL